MVDGDPDASSICALKPPKTLKARKWGARQVHESFELNNSSHTRLGAPTLGTELVLRLADCG